MKRIYDFVRRQYTMLDGVFTDREAWGLFRAAAFLETFGWMLLIVGIVFSHYKLPAYDYVLPIAGSIHGIFYLFYTLIVFFAHRSLGWGVGRFVIAEVVSNAPFGALIFEVVEARRRSRNNER